MNLQLIYYVPNANINVDQMKRKLKKGYTNLKKKKKRRLFLTRVHRTMCTLSVYNIICIFK